MMPGYGDVLQQHEEMNHMSTKHPPFAYGPRVGTDSRNISVPTLDVPAISISSESASHRSSLSRASLPESNSQAVLNALQDLMDKLKFLENSSNGSQSARQQSDAPWSSTRDPSSDESVFHSQRGANINFNKEQPSTDVTSGKDSVSRNERSDHVDYTGDSRTTASIQYLPESRPDVPPLSLYSCSSDNISSQTYVSGDNTASGQTTTPIDASSMPSKSVTSSHDAGNDPVSAGVNSNSYMGSLRSNTEAVERQFKQAEDRCANLERQLTSMQKLVDNQRSFNEYSFDKSNGSTIVITQPDAPHKAAISTTAEPAMLTIKTSDPVEVALSTNVECARSIRKVPSGRSKSKSRAVSFKAQQASPAAGDSKKSVTKRSRSADRIQIGDQAIDCSHYTHKLSEVPFVCGTSVQQSHSVNVNLQRVLAALKLHSSACHSSTVTEQLAAAASKKPPVFKPSVKRKVHKKRPATTNSNLPSANELRISASSTASRTKNCMHASEKSLVKLLQDLNEELRDLNYHLNQVKKHKETVQDPALAVQLSREQMLLRKKVEAKQQQISKIDSHLSAMRRNSVISAKNGKSRRSSSLSRPSSAPPTPASTGVSPRGGVQTRAMSKLQTSLRKDDLQWE